MGKIEARLVGLFEKTPLLRSIDLEQSGIKRIEISRYVAAGQLRRLRRGLYCLPDYRQNEHGDLAIIGKQMPEAVICLLSALRYYELTTQAPADIWIAIDRKARVPSLEKLNLRVVRFGQAALQHGVDLKLIEGVPVHITSVEKTIADCFKYRSKVGLDVALEALKDATRQKRISQNELWACAKIDRVTNVMRPYLEAIV